MEVTRAIATVATRNLMPRTSHDGSLCIRGGVWSWCWCWGGDHVRVADKGNSPPKTAGARSMKTLMQHREYSAPPACVNELRHNLSGWIIVLFVGGFRRLFLYLFISFEFRGVCGRREGGSKIEPYLYTYVAPTKAHAAQIPFFQDIPTGCGRLGAKDRAVYMLGQAGGWLSKVRLCGCWGGIVSH